MAQESPDFVAMLRGGPRRLPGLGIAKSVDGCQIRDEKLQPSPKRPANDPGQLREASRSIAVDRSWTRLRMKRSSGSIYSQPARHEGD